MYYKAVCHYQDFQFLDCNDQLLLYADAYNSIGSGYKVHNSNKKKVFEVRWPSIFSLEFWKFLRPTTIVDFFDGSLIYKNIHVRMNKCRLSWVYDIHGFRENYRIESTKWGNKKVVYNSEGVIIGNISRTIFGETPVVYDFNLNSDINPEHVFAMFLMVTVAPSA